MDLSSAMATMALSSIAKKRVVFGGAPAAVICCALLIWVAGSVDVEPALEEACHRAVAKSTPFDHREITTSTYRENDAELGVVEGRLETRYALGRWAEVGWICRINPKTGQVFRADIKEFQGAHRLKAAAAPFQLK